MPKPLSPPSTRTYLSLSEFLAALFPALDREGVRFCVLRNYEKFPTENMGGDIDFLIDPSGLARSIRALRSVPGIRITGYSERSWVAHAFVEGVSQAPGIRALQVDFLWLLNWKGQAYLPTKIILQAAAPRQAGNLNFLVPSLIHEAIVSLFASLLVGGWLKEKYFPKVQKTFANDGSGAIAALSPQFGLKQAARLVDAVTGDDQKKILNCVRPLRATVTLRSLLHGPVHGFWAAALYFAREIAVRFSPKSVETVCILGLDAGGKARHIEGLTPLLQASAKEVETRLFDTRLPLERDSHRVTPCNGLQAQTSDGPLPSMANSIRWLLEEWKNRFLGKKNLTLRLSGYACYDPFIDPENYGYRGLERGARFISRFFPSHDLWILLDAAMDGRKSKDGEALPAEALRRLEAYRAFVKTKKKYVILNASQPAARVTEEAYVAIIDMLAQRADRQLKKRFSTLDATVGDEEPAGCRE
jgi:hypothetical protein